MSILEFILIALSFIWLIVFGVIGAVIYYICEDEKDIDSKRLFWLLVFCGPICWIGVWVTKGLLYLESNPNILMRYLKDD